MTYKFTNKAITYLDTALGSTATTIVLALNEGDKFPALGVGEECALVAEDRVAGTYEIMLCTARTGDQLTVVRGQEGTSGTSWAAGTQLSLRATAAFYGGLATNVDDLLTDVSANTGSIASLQTGKLSLTGGTMTGQLSLTGARMVLDRRTESAGATIDIRGDATQARGIRLANNADALQTTLHVDSSDTLQFGSGNYTGGREIIGAWTATGAWVFDVGLVATDTLQANVSGANNNILLSYVGSDPQITLTRAGGAQQGAIKVGSSNNMVLTSGNDIRYDSSPATAGSAQTILSRTMGDARYARPGTPDTTVTFTNINAGAQSASHGLGSAPSMWKATLVCTTNDGDFSAGQRFDFPSIFTDAGGNARNGTIGVGTSNVLFKSSGVWALVNNSGVTYVLDNADWDVEVEVWG